MSSVFQKNGNRYEDLKVTVPEGKSGDWRIERFSVSEREADLDAIRSGWRAVKPGTYTVLKCNGSIIMSDTPAEIRDHTSAIRNACGNCLINGLGIGMVLQAIAKKDSVLKVTVIEKSEDVISLVADHYLSMFGNKIEIIHADAFDYNPPRGAKYEMVWHDIWDGICSGNLKEMHTLHRRYGRRSVWQGSWSRNLLESGRYRF